MRDNLDVITRRSRELASVRAMIEALQPEVEAAVEAEFGHTLFLDRPSADRLTKWRRRAQKSAARRAGFAYQGYGQIKLAGIVDNLAADILAAAPELALPHHGRIADHLHRHLAAQGLNRFATSEGGASPQTVAFFAEHDLGYRIRRLRLMARRLSTDWDDIDAATPNAREAAREAVYRVLALYFDREAGSALGQDFPDVARLVFDQPGLVLSTMATRRQLPATDLVADALLAEALQAAPRDLRRRLLLTYLGFPFYDTVTLPLLRGIGTSEIDPAKVDRISPNDCNAIRDGGAADCLRGVEFYNFGAFFSRSYRENDYLWGRLHGAERMIDLLVSALPAQHRFDGPAIAALKQEAFLAVLAAEQGRLQADPDLVGRIRDEILRKPPSAP